MLKFLASIMLNIHNFFSGLIDSYEDFFDLGADYAAKNIKNGQFINDINEKDEEVYKNAKKLGIKFFKSPFVKFLIFLSIKIANQLKKIPLIYNFYLILKDIIMLTRKYSANSFSIMFLAIFPAITILVRFLISSPTNFFVYFIPLLAVIFFFESGLFYFIEKRENNQKTSIINGYISMINNFESTIFILLFYVLIGSCLVLPYTFAISSYISFFDTLYASPASQFLYLLFFLVLSLAIFFAFFYLSIIVFQCFYAALFDKEDPVEAFIKSVSATREHFTSIAIYYLVIMSFSFFIIYFAIINFSDVGILLILTLITHFSFLFGYCIRRKLATAPDKMNITRNRRFFLIFLFNLFFFVGIIGYISTSSFLLHYYPRITQIYEKWVYENDIATNYTVYRNENYGYEIFYPLGWTVYQEKKHSTNLYYNYNDTSSGSINVKITALPISKTNYYRLFYSLPGTTINEEALNEKIIKVTNLTLDGYYAVRYQSNARQDKFMESSINYLILRGDEVFKVSFTTVNSVVEAKYKKIFETMIESLHFYK